MNRSAERHLAKAGNYFGQGEAFYRKAAAEIVAAREADPSLTYAQAGERLGRSGDWVHQVVAWSLSDTDMPTPWSGKSHADNRATAHTRRILREAPMEQVEQIIAELPKERQKQVAAAAGHEYLKARTEFEDSERNLSDRERGEREAASEAMTHKVRQAAGGFLTLGIAGHLEQATEELRELIADASITTEAMRVVIDADAAWREELQVGAAMAGLEIDLQEARR